MSMWSKKQRECIKLSVGAFSRYSPSDEYEIEKVSAIKNFTAV